jgi:phenylacetate-CoA ligase
MWTGGYTDHQSLEAAGAAVIPFGVGNSENLVEMILLLRPTAIHCTPSYLSKLENITKIKFNLSPKDLKLRLGLFGGESGLQNKSFRDYIETTWGFKAMNANYGMSEVLSMVGAECSYRMGLHFMGEDIIYPELLDLKSGEILLIEEGVIGELVLTNLRKEAQPLLRYRTNDIIKVLGTACKCSNTGFRFEVVGRSDDMLVIKGINVFVNSIERIITKYLDVVTGLYHILLSKVDPIDKIVLKIEVRGNKSQETNNFKERIIKDFKNSLGIKPDVEFISEGSLERTEDKSKIIYRNL